MDIGNSTGREVCNTLYYGTIAEKINHDNTEINQGVSMFNWS